MDERNQLLSAMAIAAADRIMPHEARVNVH